MKLNIYLLTYLLTYKFLSYFIFLYMPIKDLCIIISLEGIQYAVMRAK